MIVGQFRNNVGVDNKPRKSTLINKTNTKPTSKTSTLKATLIIKKTNKKCR